MEIQEIQPPVHTKRYVLWGDNHSRLVFLVGYCSDTLAYFAGLFAEAKRVDPTVKESEAICTKVIKSDTCQGFTLMIVTISGEEREIDGFTKTDWDCLRIEAY